MGDTETTDLGAYDIDASPPVKLSSPPPPDPPRPRSFWVSNDGHGIQILDAPDGDELLWIDRDLQVATVPTEAGFTLALGARTGEVAVYDVLKA